MECELSPKTLLEIILDKLPIDTALIFAVLVSNAILVQKYIDNGGNVNPEIDGVKYSLLDRVLCTKFHHTSYKLIGDYDVALRSIPEARRSEVVEALIKAGADVNFQNKEGNTALHLATQRENSRAVAALVEAGADVNLQNFFGWTALHAAAELDTDTIIKTLITAGADINKQVFDNLVGMQRTALHIACDFKQVRNVEILIKAGANVNMMATYGGSALHYALPEIKAFIGPDIDYDSLNYTGYDSFTECVRNVHLIPKLLIDAGIDVNQKDFKGDTALHRAVTFPGNAALVEKLLQAGADVNIQNNSGESALHFAYISKYGRIVHILKAAGADMNMPNKDGDTALHTASKSTANEVVRELIAAGVDINGQNYNGDTALHQNIKGICNFEVLETLIASGARVNIKNKQGHEPFQQRIYGSNTLLNICKLEKHFSQYRTVYGNTIFHVVSGNYCHHEGKYYSVYRENNELVRYIQSRQMDFVKYLGIQNMFGETPLHIASSKETGKDETLDFIFYAFNKCDIDLLTADENGNTFLHRYMSRLLSKDGTHYDTAFLKCLLEGEYENCSKEKVTRLVQSRNKTGHDPLHFFVASHFMTSLYQQVFDIEAVLEMFLKAGANFNLFNSLGETVLFSLTDLFKGQTAVEFAVKNGADLNIQNIFGESSVFLVPHFDETPSRDRNACSNPYEAYLKLLTKYGVKIDVCNKTGQTPLIVHMLQMCAIFRSVIPLFENNLDISKQDIHGSNLLHYIAWTHWFEVFDHFDFLDLFNWPGLRVLPDNLGQLPCDIAYLQGHENILRDICICKNGVHMKKLVFSPKNISFEALEKKDDVFRNCVLDKCKYFSEESIRDIVNEPFIGFVNFDEEAKAVKTAVISIVEDICKRIEQKDKLLSNTLILTGSVAENAKVGLPDEFDFVCVLDKLQELLDIEECTDKSYINVNLKKEYRGNSCSHFFRRDEGFRLCQHRLFDRFNNTLKEIMKMSDIYTKHPHIYHMKPGVRAPYNSPNFKLYFKWSCCKYKNLRVKVDLVPACKINLPTNSKVYSETFNPKKNDSEAILIMFQTVKDNDEKIRISAVNAEKQLFKSLSQAGKDAYVIAKILCSNRVCPSVPNVCHKPRKNDREPTCASFVSSYMLKNCLFHIFKEELFETLSKRSVHWHVCKIFEKLLQCAREENLPCYMLPWQNIFKFQSECNEQEISAICQSRAMYAKIILNILGKNEDFIPRKFTSVIRSPSPTVTDPMDMDSYICANCKKNPDQHGIILEPCSRCKLWTYCSEKCRVDNLERHKLACDYHYTNLC